MLCDHRLPRNFPLAGPFWAHVSTSKHGTYGGTALRQPCREKKNAYLFSLDTNMKHFGHPYISKGFWKQSESYHILVKIRLWTWLMVERKICCKLQQLELLHGSRGRYNMNPRGYLLSMMATLCAGLEGLPREEYGINHDVFLETPTYFGHILTRRNKRSTQKVPIKTITELRGLVRGASLTWHYLTTFWGDLFWRNPALSTTGSWWSFSLRVGSVGSVESEELPVPWLPTEGRKHIAYGSQDMPRGLTWACAEIRRHMTRLLWWLGFWNLEGICSSTQRRKTCQTKGDC